LQIAETPWARRAAIGSRAGAAVGAGAVVADGVGVGVAVGVGVGHGVDDGVGEGDGRSVTVTTLLRACGCGWNTPTMAAISMPIVSGLRSASTTTRSVRRLLIAVAMMNRLPPPVSQTWCRLGA
jgi:hypothetical protein